jgi:hypothetical protein
MPGDTVSSSGHEADAESKQPPDFFERLECRVCRTTAGKPRGDFQSIDPELAK